MRRSLTLATAATLALAVPASAFAHNVCGPKPPPPPPKPPTPPVVVPPTNPPPVPGCEGTNYPYGNPANPDCNPNYVPPAVTPPADTPTVVVQTPAPAPAKPTPVPRKQTPKPKPPKAKIRATANCNSKTTTVTVRSTGIAAVSLTLKAKVVQRTSTKWTFKVDATRYSDSWHDAYAVIKYRNGTRKSLAFDAYTCTFTPGGLG